MNAVSVWLYIPFLVLAVIFAAVFTIRRGKKTDATSLLLKVVASICFILLGFCGLLIGGGFSVALFLVIGLVCGLVGDAYLDMKYVYPKDAVMHTFTGFGAFMLGHVFYTIFLFIAYPVLPAHLPISIGGGILVGIVIYVTPKLMKLDYGKFRLIASVYAALLVFVTIYALLLLISLGVNAPRLMFFIGIVLFLISDLILSQIYFGENKNTTGAKIANHASYYAAQILIALSVTYFCM